MLALDGIHIDEEEGGIAFRPVSPPSDAEVARVTERIHRRIAKLLERRGLGPQSMTKPIPFCTTSRCSPNSTALRFPAALPPGHMPASASQRPAMRSIWKTSPFPTARAVPRCLASGCMLNHAEHKSSFRLFSNAFIKPE
jgi:hypothetical protein